MLRRLFDELCLTGEVPESYSISDSVAWSTLLISRLRPFTFSNSLGFYALSTSVPKAP